MCQLCFKAKTSPASSSAQCSCICPWDAASLAGCFRKQTWLGSISPTAWQHLTWFCLFSQVPVSSCHLLVPPGVPALGWRWSCHGPSGGLLRCRGASPCAGLEQGTLMKLSTYQGRDGVVLWCSGHIGDIYQSLVCCQQERQGCSFCPPALLRPAGFSAPPNSFAI